VFYETRNNIERISYYYKEEYIYVIRKIYRFIENCNYLYIKKYYEFYQGLFVFLYLKMCKYSKVYNKKP